MRNTFILMTCLLVVSCLDSKRNNKDSSHQIPSTKEVGAIDSQQDSVAQQKIESPEFTLESINSCIKVNYEFQDREIIEKQDINIDNKRLFLIKIEPMVPIEALGNDPIANLVFLVGESNRYVNIPSVYSEDFKLLDNRKDLVIFEYYSSPVGYTQLMIIDTTSGELFESDKIQETEELLLASIDIGRNRFIVIDEKGNKQVKHHKQKKWLLC